MTVITAIPKFEPPPARAARRPVLSKAAASAVRESEGTKTGRWMPDEHARFLRALEDFKTHLSECPDAHWKKWPRIAAAVGTRTTLQCRSHAQKYFLKLRRRGNSESRRSRRQSRPNEASSSSESLLSVDGPPPYPRPAIIPFLGPPFTPMPPAPVPIMVPMFLVPPGCKPWRPDFFVPPDAQPNWDILHHFGPHEVRPSDDDALRHAKQYDPSFFEPEPDDFKQAAACFAAASPVPNGDPVILEI
ncbi:hypothetical protein CTAYLR_000493 [Chrysophaeum taylorii]|uniref:MYB transcription factor n=1 Tax=Chrysophaeum taylorii TaxID=2483200 RepID=A0AAD7XLY5_9STRA|nr:hypothetical protein CTAYLR_000493 [Chrysophaeum taylorii]